MVLEGERKLDASLNRTHLNSWEQERSRRLDAVRTPVSQYTHQGMDQYPYLKLLLRAVTGALTSDGRYPEPFMNEEGKRKNGGCDAGRSDCLLTWDGWARSMATGDVLHDVLKRDIPGAVAEVGIYKGGLSAYLQGMLIATGEARKGWEMWLIDSFKGLPPTSLMKSANDQSESEYNGDMKQAVWAGKLSCGLQSVRDNLDSLGLMDFGNVYFLEGWVQDTLSGWNAMRPLSLLRVDVDIYSATYSSLFIPTLEQGWCRSL